MKSLVETRLSSAGDKQGKSSWSQHHNGSAEETERDPPFVLLFVILPLRLVTVAEFPPSGALISC